MTGTTVCSECGAEVLARTATKTGGRCLPCARGTRAEIERGKRRAAEDRERQRTNEAALARIRGKGSATFGDVLAEADPVAVLWSLLVSLVFSDSGDETLAILTPPARTLYLVGVLDGEIFNGGIHQYFSNSSGRHAHETLSVLVELGAAESAKILQAAISAFPDQRVPRDRAERNGRLDQVSTAFLASLDTRYYALADSGAEDLAALMVAFMRRHAGSPLAA